METEIMNETTMEETKELSAKEIRKMQFDTCKRFFDQVAILMADTHVILESSNKNWRSAQLVPKGMEFSARSYNGKPHNSLRVACNWNWRASLVKCQKPQFVQCYTNDLPHCRPRPKDRPEGASAPVWGNMVGYYDTDNSYHCVFGEYFNKETNSWVWKENTPLAVALMMKAKIAAEKETEKNENTAKTE